MSFNNHVLAVLVLALLLATSAAVVSAKDIERETVTTINARLSLDKSGEVRLASDDFVTNGSDKYSVKNVPIRGADDSQDKELKRLAAQGEKAILRGQFNRVHLHQIDELDSEIIFDLIEFTAGSSSAFVHAGDLYRITDRNTLITTRREDLQQFMNLNAQGNKYGIRLLYRNLNQAGYLLEIRPGTVVEVEHYYDDGTARIACGSKVGYIAKSDLSVPAGSR